MAEATPAEILDAFWVLLKAALTEPVSIYNPGSAPTELSCYVDDGGEDDNVPEHLDSNIGDMEYWRVKVIVVCRIPWDGKAATAVLLDALVKAVRAVVTDNRDLTVAGADNPIRGTVNGVRPAQIVQFQGSGEANVRARQKIMDVSWTV